VPSRCCCRTKISHIGEGWSIGQRRAGFHLQNHGLSSRFAGILAGDLLAPNQFRDCQAVRNGRAKQSLIKKCGWKGGDYDDNSWRKTSYEQKKKNQLDTHRPSYGSDYAPHPRTGHLAQAGQRTLSTGTPRCGCASKLDFRRTSQQRCQASALTAEHIDTLATLPSPERFTEYLRK